MKHLTILSFLICLSLFVAKSQSISNVVAKQEGNNVVITYNLQCNVSADISLLVSEEGDGIFNWPLVNVSGDVGNDITPGNKTIIWNALKEQDMIVGENVVFKVKGNWSKFDKMTDSRDGKIYKTVKIGNQLWMAQNLAYKSSIGCLAYDNNELNMVVYGYLYSYDVANSVCPSGWHLPTNKEWTVLIDYLGGRETAGIKLKESVPTPWGYFNNDTKNETGFSALPGGDFLFGHFGGINHECTFWISRNSDDTFYCIRLTFFDGNVSRGDISFGQGKFSIRCIKD